MCKDGKCVPFCRLNSLPALAKVVTPRENFDDKVGMGDGVTASCPAGHHFVHQRTGGEGVSSAQCMMAGKYVYLVCGEGGAWRSGEHGMPQCRESCDPKGKVVH